MVSGSSVAHAGRVAWTFPTLRGYRRAWLGPDILAGAAAGAVVIPQAMAYATIANLPVEVGLYTCMLPMLVYAFLGGSPAMSVSTTSTIATLVATTFVAAGVAEASADPARALAMLTLLVGVILVIARVLRLGSLVENINQATLIGIKVGLGATVALGQVPKMLGVDVQPTGDGFIRVLVATVEAVPQGNVATILLSLATLAVLVGLRRVAPRVPAQLLVVVAGILLVALAGLDRLGVALIDPVPTGLPAPVLPDLALAGPLLPGALAIAVMAFLETASVARSLRRTGEPPIDSDRELLANGVASVAGAFFQSLPPAGGFSQSAVNQRAGARSQLASIVTVILAVLVALFLAGVLDNLPQATLASMVFVAVAGLIDVKGMARLARISRTEFWISVCTAAVGLAAGLLPAVATGVLITLGLVLHELNRPRVTSERRGDRLIVRPTVGLYTANVLATERAIEGMLDELGPDVTVLEFDASALHVVTVTVLDALADFDHQLAERGVRLEVVGLPAEPLEVARRVAWWRDLEAQGRAR